MVRHEQYVQHYPKYDFPHKQSLIKHASIRATLARWDRPYGDFARNVEQEVSYDVQASQLSGDPRILSWVLVKITGHKSPRSPGSRKPANLS